LLPADLVYDRRRFMTGLPHTDALTEKRAWALVLALRERVASRGAVADGTGLRLDDRGALEEGGTHPWVVARASERGWSRHGGTRLDADVEQLLDIYMPFCTRESFAVAHLGQTLDGRIAIASGDSKFITSQENLLHAHRMRALCDAVIVGRRTVRSDDPELTTRLCAGPSPVRVVLDPNRRLAESHRVFSSESGSTLLLCNPEAAARGKAHGRAEVVAVESEDGVLGSDAIVAELARRKLRRLYVEGGGLTVSRFVAARTLSGLQITVAPVVFGSGVPSFVLPEIGRLSDALTLRVRTFAMGRDVLFDCAFAS
jgi:riboflavin-specific deaminase-like protein